MGSFIVSFHAKTPNRDKVLAAFKPLAAKNAYVTDAKNGWVSFYDSAASGQDDALITRISGDISKQAACPVIAFLVHDSDFLIYWLYDQGRSVDTFNSCPEYFEDEEEESTMTQSAGQPEVLAKFCPPGTSVEALKNVLARTDLAAMSGLGEILSPEKLQQQIMEQMAKQRPQLEKEFPMDFQALQQMVLSEISRFSGSVAASPTKPSGPDATSAPQYVFAEDRLRALAELLGIDPDRATADAKYIKQGEPGPQEISAEKL